tara:strand:+ start:2200 stop:2715 length:516 start_codon:yes stop_codon:yes gene_type:complete
MGESLKCDICGKLATVHLTQIVNNKIHKVNLCEECAQQKGVTSSAGFSLADMLAQNLDLSLEGMEESSQEPHCTHCGCTVEGFKKHGRLGCPDCYVALKSVIEPILGNIHKEVIHKGKRPVSGLTRIEFKKQVEALDEQIETAIAEERYEDAARLRDEIRVLENQMPTTES